MLKLSSAEQKMLDNQEPWAQLVRLGARLKEDADSGLVYINIPQAAGAVGLVTNAPLSADPDLVFDFEVMDIIVRTETAVTSSAVALRNGTTAVSNTIISAADKTITRPGTIDIAYNKFYPKSLPAAYAAATCNILDSGGATAAARTVTLVCRRL